MAMDPALTNLVAPIAGGAGVLGLAVALVRAAGTYALAQHDLAKAVERLAGSIDSMAADTKETHATQLQMLSELVRRINGHGAS